MDVGGSFHRLPQLVDVLRRSKQKVPPDMVDMARKFAGTQQRLGSLNDAATADEDAEMREEQQRENRERQAENQKAKTARNRTQGEQAPRQGRGKKKK